MTIEDSEKDANGAAHGPPPEPSRGDRGLGRAEKVRVTIRLDRAVLDYFKAAGPGWQDRINAALRKAAGLDPSR